MNTITDLLGYENEYAIEEILKSFKITLLLNKDDNRIDKFIKLSNVQISLPMLIKIIDEYRPENIIKFVKKKSPHELVNKFIASIYYALFIALDLENRDYHDIKNDILTNRISAIALKFHYNYLKYKNDEKNNIHAKEQSDEFYERILIALTRVIEILAKFANYKENSMQHIHNVYFKNMQDLDEIFFEIISNESSLEHLYFSIKEDKSVSNYISYDNYREGINIQIESSRKLKKGSSKISMNDNKNIIDYLKDGYNDYKKLLGLEFKTSEHKKEGKYNVRHGILQYTEEDDLLNSIWSVNQNSNQEFAKEDTFDAINKQKKKSRYITKENIKEIPTLGKQRERNKAFSANITKRTLLLESNYEIPPLEIFKEFIKEFSNNDNNIKFIYDSIFLIDSVLGMGYTQIIELFLKSKKNIIIRGDMLIVAVNKKLFARYKHSYIHNNSNIIYYYIPKRFKLLIEKASNLLVELNIDDMNNEDQAKNYFDYINDKKKSFKYTINFNAKHMWKLITNFVKSLEYEDMTAIFCIGRYQQNDAPRLAYNSTPKESMKHSKVIEEFYMLLGVHDILGKLLELEDSIYEKSFKFNKIDEFTGSSQAVKKDIAIEFFHRMKQLIKNYKNTKTDFYFNLISIYTRYALSILLGTRDYTDSVRLDRCSLLTSTLIITEKSNTLLSGIRIIPLCKKAKEVIENYRKICKDYDINANNIYLIVNKSINVYKKEDAALFCKENNLDNFLCDFVESVPLNTGRHVIVREAFYSNFKLHYLESLLGHYISGGEQHGIYSNMNSKNYIISTQSFLETISYEYNI